MTETDWSGKGARVGYDINEPALLEELEVIGLGTSSLVTKVRSTRRGPNIFAKKTLEKRGHLLRLEMLLQEVKVLVFQMSHPRPELPSFSTCQT